MKFILAASVSLLGLVSARPAPSDDPVRTLPRNWRFNITALEGPGCPDFGKPDGSGNLRSTRLTYGSNSVDGTEIYNWFIAYPALHVELGKTESVWCEAEVLYTELAKVDSDVETADYRLRLHKNVTQIVATYDLDKDVEATFTFAYLDADVTDSLSLTGPTLSGDTWPLLYMKSPTSEPPHRVPTCGAAKLKFRTELKIGGTGEKGVVDSGHSTNDDGTIQYYGTQLGFSYDWEKCDE